MARTAAQLLQNLETLKTAKGELVREPDLTAFKSALASFHAQEAASLFADIHGIPCPGWMEDWLALPDWAEWSWRSANAAAEARLAHPLLLMERTLDAAYAGLAEAIAPPGDLLVLDETGMVTATGFVVIERARVEAPTLWHCDTHVMARLDIAAGDYLDLVAKNLGADGWHYAYLDTPVTPDRRQRLERSAAWLEAERRAEAEATLARIEERLAGK